MNTLFIDEKYKSLSFWAWNDALKENELTEQILSLKEGGFGGFFMHSREGLETVYLSNEWLSCVKHSAQIGKKYGLRPFIYDEDKWPSGMAGGMVTKDFPMFSAKAFAYIEESDSVETVNSLGHSWYSGYPPADNLSKESVAKFIEITHEKYLSYFENDLKGNVEGFFTDEPNFWDFFFNIKGKKRPMLPYTENLFEEFKQRRGYELNPRLLFLKEENHKKHRHDYFRTLSELFTQNYTKQIYDWCEKHGVKSCGHLLFENELGYQVRVCGAAMPNYKYFHIPGIDILGEQTREYITVKQCTSVANQYGKEATMSETFGCTGWDFTFEGQKKLWDFQCVLGINIRSQHLSLYSIKGLRKRDYPPAFSYQAEWFKYNHVIEDYCSRLSTLMSQGKAKREVLIIHPISSFWCESGSNAEEDLSEFEGNMGWKCKEMVSLNAKGDELNLFAESLLKNGIDFDFGDEQLIEADGYIEETLFCIAQAKYKVVVLPNSTSIFNSTKKLLEKFLKNGGVLIIVGKTPYMIEGEKREVYFEGEINVHSFKEAVNILKTYVKNTVEIIDLHTQKTPNAITVFRQFENKEYMAVVNEETPCECKFMLNKEVSVFEVDLLKGCVKQVEVGYENEFYTQLSKNDCKVFILESKPCKKTNVKRVYTHPHQSEKPICALSPVVQFERTMPNSLILDKCKYCLESEEFSKEMQVWEVQKEIRERLSFKQIYTNGVDMRYNWIFENKKTHKIKLEFEFFIENMLREDLYVCIEEGERFEVKCNEKNCNLQEGYFIDKCIKKFALNNYKKGKNIIELSCEYGHYMELEDIYIIGDFGVSINRHIINEPKYLRIGDITMQGYFHYAGSIKYKFNCVCERNEKGTLAVGDYFATLLAIKVNNKPAGYIISGDRINIELQKGNNDIEIELVCSNRNLLGPFHQKYDGCSRISWEDFRTQGELYTEEYIVKAYGLFSLIKIIGE